MRDRWIEWAHHSVPEPARSRVFEPALADLEIIWQSRPVAPHSTWGRRWAVMRLARQCRRLARRDAAGSTLPFKERARMWGQDVRFGFRRLGRQPAFVATSVLTLALGIGANLSVGAYVESFLLAPVNAPDPDELFRVSPETAGGRSKRTVSWPLYVEARDGVPGVDLAAQAAAPAQIGPAEAAELRMVGLVSGNYFGMLRLTPSAGRFIGPADNVAELASAVAVLSDAYWRARFGGDPGAVGRTLLINGASFEIVGIAPPGFQGDEQARAIDLWTPLMMQQWVRPRGTTVDTRGWGWLQLIGRREADVPLAEVGRRFDLVADDVNRRFPPSDDEDALVLAVIPAAAVTASERSMLSPVLTATLAFTGLLFLVTCANLAGVMQSRLLARRRELAIRQSLGAGRGRLFSEWFAECAILALAGGLVGLAAARGLIGVLGDVQPPAQLVGDLSFAASFDWRLGLVALGLSFVAAMLFGALPAWRAGARAPVGWLRSEGGTMTTGRSGVRMRRVAVVAQLALAGVLLFSATLLARSLVNQQGYDTGFETGHLGLLSYDLRRQRVPESDFGRLASAAVERIRQDPAVVAADVAMSVPLGFGSDSMGLRIPGYEPPDERGFVSVDFNVVGSGYFLALGTPFVSGTGWSSTLTGDQPPQIVVNETMARRFWQGGRAVGQTVEIIGVANATVVGVVQDVAYYDVGADPIPYLYVPAEMQPLSSFIVHVRTEGEPAPVIGRLAQAVAAVDPRLSSHEVLSFEELRRIPLFPVRLLATSALVFGGIAFLLASVGLYGVISMSVGARTREIGVRMALGARPAMVLSSVVREALVLASTGLVLALGAGYAANGALQSWLFQIPRFDVVTALAVALLLGLLAIVASWIPASRAARIDPLLALRQD